MGDSGVQKKTESLSKQELNEILKFGAENLFKDDESGKRKYSTCRRGIFFHKRKGLRQAGNEVQMFWVLLLELISLCALLVWLESKSATGIFIGKVQRMLIR